MTLRKATADDREFVFRTTEAAFRPYVEQTYGAWDEARQRELHAERFQLGGIQIVVVDGVEVGCLTVAQEGEEINLKQIFLRPAYQSRGIGKACLELLMAQGLPIRLRVMKVNTRAQAFYRNLGFVDEEETETHFRMRWVPPSI